MCVPHRDGAALAPSGDRHEVAVARSLFRRSQVVGELDHAAGPLPDSREGQRGVST